MTTKPLTQKNSSAFNWEEKSVESNTTPYCCITYGDSKSALSVFQDCIDLIVTSPPYADARKNHYDSFHPKHFPEWLASFHKAFWNALKPSGSLVINIKDKVVDGVRCHYVWKTIEKLESLGWYCIDDYIWHKTNPMPGHWPTRLRDGWEYCFHLAKSKKPYINQNEVRIPVGEWAKSRLDKLGENDLKRHNSANNSGFGRDISRWVGKKDVLPSNVISLALVGKDKGHPAVFPIELPQFFIKLLCPPHGLVADPFSGSGSTGIAALALKKDCILIDNNANFCRLAYERILNESKLPQDHLFLSPNTPQIISKADNNKIKYQPLLDILETDINYVSESNKINEMEFQRQLKQRHLSTT